MKSFKQYLQYLEEASIRARLQPPVSALGKSGKTNIKGWVHTSGKVVLEKVKGNNRPYHVEILVKNPKKFDKSEQDLVDVLTQAWGVDDEEVESTIKDYKTGKADKSKELAMYMHQGGWAEVVVDGYYNSINMGDRSSSRDMQKIVKILDKKFTDKQLFNESGAIVELYPSNKHGRINNSTDWRAFIKTGKVPKRTSIGATMAQFREEKVHEAVLMDLINKNDSPLGFLADAMEAISNGTLKLKTRGVANTRELAAAWNRVKKKKIKI